MSSNGGRNPTMVVAPWAHDYDGNSIDPINLVVDTMFVGDVTSALEGITGWDRPQVADQLYIHVGAHVIPDEDQLAHGFFSIANAFRRIIRYGLPHPRYRVHVRFWQMPSNATLLCLNLGPTHFPVVASAHIEPQFWFHKPESFEWGEKMVARELRRIGWNIQFDEVALNNMLQSPPNNGFATKAWR